MLAILIDTINAVYIYLNTHYFSDVNKYTANES